jgi:hypothetical protein
VIGQFRDLDQSSNNARGSSCSGSHDHSRWNRRCNRPP